MTAESVRQHFGHVIDVLRGMGGAGVQMIATSPPYFGLRDYGLEPVVWAPVVYAPMPGLPPVAFPAYADPEAFAACEHDWSAWSERKDIREATRHGKTRTTDRFYGDESRRFDGNHRKHAHGQFCRHCGAWRGCLGLEGDPNLYIGHLLQVFREAWRVLADDGVLWLNLGDSYARDGDTDVKNPPNAIVGNTRTTLAQIRSRKQRVTGGLKAKDLIGANRSHKVCARGGSARWGTQKKCPRGDMHERDYHGQQCNSRIRQRPSHP